MISINESIFSADYVFKEYILVLRDESLKLFLDDVNLRSIGNKTNCHIELTKRILNRRVNAYKLVKYAIIKVMGANNSEIRQCNRLLENQFPLYRHRKEYQRKFHCCTLFAQEFIPDNSSLYFPSQRTGASNCQYGDILVKSPYEPTNTRPNLSNRWSDKDLKKGIIISERRQVEAYLNYYLRNSSNAQHQHDPTLPVSYSCDESTHISCDQFNRESPIRLKKYGDYMIKRHERFNSTCKESKKLTMPIAILSNAFNEKSAKIDKIDQDSLINHCVGLICADVEDLLCDSGNQVDIIDVNQTINIEESEEVIRVEGIDSHIEEGESGSITIFPNIESKLSTTTGEYIIENVVSRVMARSNSSTSSVLQPTGCILALERCIEEIVEEIINEIVPRLSDTICEVDAKVSNIEFFTESTLEERRSSIEDVNNAAFQDVTEVIIKEVIIENIDQFVYSDTRRIDSMKDSVCIEVISDLMDDYVKKDCLSNVPSIINTERDSTKINEVEVEIPRNNVSSAVKQSIGNSLRDGDFVIEVIQDADTDFIDEAYGMNGGKKDNAIDEISELLQECTNVITNEIEADIFNKQRCAIEDSQHSILLKDDNDEDSNLFREIINTVINANVNDLCEEVERICAQEISMESIKDTSIREVEEMHSVGILDTFEEIVEDLCYDVAEECTIIRPDNGEAYDNSQYSPIVLFEDCEKASIQTGGSIDLVPHPGDKMSGHSGVIIDKDRLSSKADNKMVSFDLKDKSNESDNSSRLVEKFYEEPIRNPTGKRIENDSTRESNLEDSQRPPFKIYRPSKFDSLTQPDDKDQFLKKLDQLILESKNDPKPDGSHRIKEIIYKGSGLTKDDPTSTRESNQQNTNRINSEEFGVPSKCDSENSTSTSDKNLLQADETLLDSLIRVTDADFFDTDHGDNKKENEFHVINVELGSELDVVCLSFDNKAENYNEQCEDESKERLDEHNFDYLFESICLESNLKTKEKEASTESVELKKLLKNLLTHENMNSVGKVKPTMTGNITADLFNFDFFNKALETYCSDLKEMVLTYIDGGQTMFLSWNYVSCNACCRPIVEVKDIHESVLIMYKTKNDFRNQAKGHIVIAERHYANVSNNEQNFTVQNSQSILFPLTNIDSLIGDPQNSGFYFESTDSHCDSSRRLMAPDTEKSGDFREMEASSRKYSHIKEESTCSLIGSASQSTECSYTIVECCHPDYENEFVNKSISKTMSQYCITYNEKCLRTGKNDSSSSEKNTNPWSRDIFSKINYNPTSQSKHPNVKKTLLDLSQNVRSKRIHKPLIPQEALQMPTAINHNIRQIFQSLSCNKASDSSDEEVYSIGELYNKQQKCRTRTFSDKIKYKTKKLISKFNNLRKYSDRRKDESEDELSKTSTFSYLLHQNSTNSNNETSSSTQSSNTIKIVSNNRIQINKRSLSERLLRNN